ncbi:MAG TPA: STAS domain-containing protein [Solirubrobacteraceae bacterium]|nr:STAS domain-containing protein [Solirubrobacteraceae bacterium]
MFSRSDNSSTSKAAPFAVARRDRDERTSVVSVTGELDLSTAPQLKWALVDALEQGRSSLVVDLSLTSFMDSTALGVLVGVNRSLPDGSRLAIVCHSPALLRIFELSGMDAAFAIHPTLDAALAVQAPAPRVAEAG